METFASVIIGTGSYLPNVVVKNSDFVNYEFYQENGEKFPNSTLEIAEKLKDITGIEERRYAEKDQVNSDLALIAAQRAIDDAGIDPETLDLIIVGTNFGDIQYNSNQPDFLPGVGTKVKHGLGIKNPYTVAFDIVFGCPGWLQAFIIAETYVKAGMAKRALIIGTETLSRVVDKHDRDAMIFADGAGAVVIEAQATNGKKGVLSTAVRTDTKDEVMYLHWGKSYKPDTDENVGYVKMLGRKIYEYSLSNVPAAMKLAMDRAGVDILELKKVFIHQANEKMDDAIIKRFFRLYKSKVPEMVMPMSIQKYGNNSVATIPILLDEVLHNKREGHELKEGDVIMFASVGAGMHINAMVYKI